MLFQDTPCTSPFLMSSAGFERMGMAASSTTPAIAGHAVPRAVRVRRLSGSMPDRSQMSTTAKNTSAENISRAPMG